MFSDPLRIRPENRLGMRLLGYDSSTVKLPKRRQCTRYALRELPEDRTKLEPTTVATQIGPINLAQLPFAPLKNRQNELNGIVKRLIHEQRPPKVGDCDDIVKYVREFILPYIKPLHPGASYEQLKSQWDEANSYTLKRRQTLQHLRDQYIMENGEYWDPKLLRCKMFMKEEFYQEKKHARLIISRNDTFKGIIGPYAHAFDEELFHGHFAENFVKGKDSQWKVKRMQDIYRTYPICMETDYSSFEGSQSRAIQDAIELEVFRHYFQNHPHILELIEMTYEDRRLEDLSVKEIRKLKIAKIQPYIFSKYHGLGLVGNRKSGEMWTSSGNGLLNIVIMKYLSHTYGVNFDGIVEGDDGFFGVDQPILQDHHYARLGFTIKLHYETDPNELSFCGLRFSRDGTYLIDPERLNRIGWNEKRKYFKCNKKTKLQLLKARCLSLLSEAPNCPMTSIFAYNVIKNIKAKEKLNPLDWWDRRIYEENKANLKYERPIITDRARLDFYYMYGIGPETQKNIERSFDQNWWDNFSIVMPNCPDTYCEGLVATVSAN